MRTYLNLADVENIDNLLHIFVLEESLVFMEKPAVLRVLEEGAKSLSCHGVKLRNRDKRESPTPPKAAASGEASPPHPAQDILNRARSMGIPIK